MDIRVLRYFLTVAREESFSKAAESLYLSQPTLSRQIRDMEEQFGRRFWCNTRGGSDLLLVTAMSSKDGWRVDAESDPYAVEDAESWTEWYEGSKVEPEVWRVVDIPSSSRRYHITGKELRSIDDMAESLCDIASYRSGVWDPAELRSCECLSNEDAAIVRVSEFLHALVSKAVVRG